jgi:hypothetical protein
MSMKPNVDYTLQNTMHAFCDNINIRFNKTDERTERRVPGNFPLNQETKNKPNLCRI